VAPANSPTRTANQARTAPRGPTDAERSEAPNVALSVNPLLRY
jgi:hypothetical protein